MSTAKIYWITFDRRHYRVRIEKIYQSNQVIRYCIIGRNKSIIMQSNEPLYRNKGMKHRKPDWKLIEGHIHTSGFLDALIRKLEQVRKEELRQNNSGLQSN